jgi:peptidoglycan-associated lipoprotein
LRRYIPLIVPVLLSMVLTGTACKKKVPATDLPDAPLATEPKQAEPAKVIPPEVQEMVSNFSKVYFDFDAAILNGDSKAALDANALIMQKYTDVKVEVQGNADERGTTDYNLALGQKRADAVVKYLQARGISSSRVKTVSYGEERPAVSGSSETAFAQNRRAEFVITYGAGAPVQGTSGG